MTKALILETFSRVHLRMISVLIKPLNCREKYVNIKGVFLIEYHSMKAYWEVEA